MRNNKEIGLYIKKLRIEKNLSQQELSDRLFLSRKSLSKIENGNGTINLETLNILVKEFNISIDELLYGNKKLNVNKKVELNNNRSKMLKFYTLAISIIVFICCIIFGIYYFFINYKSVNVYYAYGSSNNYNINTSLLVLTKDKIFFKIDLDNKDKINNIKLYYHNIDGDKIVYQADEIDGVILTDYYGAKLLLDYDEILKEKASFYLVITDIDNKEEIIDIQLKKEYENKKIFVSKMNPALLTDTDEVIQNYSIPENIINNFKLYEGVYQYKNGNANISFYPEANLLYITEEYDDYFDYYIYDLLSAIKYERIKKDGDIEKELFFKEKNISSAEERRIFEYLNTNYFEKFLK